MHQQSAAAADVMMISVRHLIPTPGAILRGVAQRLEQVLAPSATLPQLTNVAPAALPAGWLDWCRPHMTTQPRGHGLADVAAPLGPVVPASTLPTLRRTTAVAMSQSCVARQVALLLPALGGGAPTGLQSSWARLPTIARQMGAQRNFRTLAGNAERGDEDSDRDGDRAAVAQADARPHDVELQAAALRHLAASAPYEAIKRFESGQFASDDACVKAYITALVKTNRLGQTNLRRVFADQPSNSSTTFSGSRPGPPPGAAASSGKLFEQGAGSPDAPLYVAMQEPTMRTQLWRIVRTMVVMLLLISAMNQVMEDRGMGGKSGQAAHEVLPEATDRVFTFEDVQGADEAKDELQQVVKYLRNPQEFTRLGGKLPKGVLLMGPPGTGKTLLARAVAGEAGVPFFYCSGSEFDEMFVGVGARRVRELFAAAKKKQPCIIFMDEIDAIGGKRSAKDQQFTKMTLNQLLVELDGFKQNEGVIVIAATNFPEMLDAALIRPGRFDTHVTVPLPDRNGREKILRSHARSVVLADPKDLSIIARGTPGFSGAELANVINQAALKASQDMRESIDLRALEWAKDKILMGAERKSSLLSDQDRKLTAYHEAGHALCALFTEGATPVYKATIIPRGNALGMVTQLPEDDRNSMTRKEMLARLVVCMGGRAAEERIFGHDHVTSGASSDVEQATRLATAMVTKYAMSDKIGPVKIDDDQAVSAETRKLIESEVRRLCADALEGAHVLLNKHDKEHHRLAKALLEHEDLNADEMRAVIRGDALPQRAY